MSTVAALLTDFDREMAKTRLILASVPDAPLGKLANHLAAMPIFAAAIVKGMAQKAHEATTSEELLQALPPCPPSIT